MLVNSYYSLLCHKSDRYANDDHTNFINKFAPTVNGFGHVDVHGRLLRGGRRGRIGNGSRILHSFG